MDNERRGTAAPSETPGTSVTSPAGQDVHAARQRVVRRRSFLQAGVGLGVATAALPTGALLAPTAAAASKERKGGRLNKGDRDILRFLQLVETLENDLWVQYNELGGNNGISNDGAPSLGVPPLSFSTAGVAANYMAALVNLDSDMPQYISDNADDELSHMLFLAAYLRSKGETPIDLSGPKFNTQPASQVSTLPKDLRDKKRLTNLQHLTVDTSYYTRYRSTENPDAPFNATFTGPFGLSMVNEPGIPPTDADDTPANPPPPKNLHVSRVQAIANTAAFHFGFIEQGGSSLYPIMALKVTDLEVLRIVLSIGGTEIDHFSLWHDKLGGAVSDPLAPLTDPNNANATFPNLNLTHDNDDQELRQTNLILAEPCDFISESLPECSVIRPTSVAQGGAVATINAFKADGLFGLTGPGARSTRTCSTRPWRRQSKQTRPAARARSRAAEVELAPPYHSTCPPTR